MSTVPPPLPVPGPASRRVEGIDAVRGFAILGLIFANIPYFASADFYRSLFFQVPSPGLAGGAVDFLVEFFISGKCMALLAFLLGAGIAFQQARAAACGEDFLRLTARRMGALMIFGFLHIVLLWCGDILLFYSLLGLGLLALHRLPAKILRVIALACIAGNLLMFAGLSLLATDYPPVPDITQAAPKGEEEHWETERMIQKVETIYRAGSYSKILLVRLVEAFVSFGLLTLCAPLYFGLVLLGYDSIRSGWFPWDGKIRHRRILVPLMAASALLALPAAWLGAFHPDGKAAHILFFVSFAASPGMAALYLHAFLRLREGVPRRCLAAVGKTALSNYLLQSLLAAGIFYAWGIGLYGKLDRVQVAAVAAGIMAVQLSWPGLWLRYFRFGPMEYLWRLLTYGRAAGTLRGARLRE